MSQPAIYKSKEKTFTGTPGAWKSNAQLIAAAPELLSALQLAVLAFKELGVSENQNCYKTALKAINKALK